MQLAWLVAEILYELFHMSLYCAAGEILATHVSTVHDTKPTYY